MLEQRKLGCERVNDIFGTNWSVDIAPEIKIIMEEGGNEDVSSYNDANSSESVDS